MSRTTRGLHNSPHLSPDELQEAILSNEDAHNPVLVRVIKMYRKERRQKYLKPLLQSRSPSFIYGADAAHSSSNQDTDDCSVCLTTFQKDTEVRRLLCKHLFHMECVDRWLENSNDCPVCRHPVVTEKVGVPPPTMIP